MAQETTANNKRIALNTLYMYIRLFITLFIGLYTSRVVLEILGVVDYGLFNVVGGVLALFTFISSSLGSATTRFLNAEMGKVNGDVNKSFNINKVLHIAFAVIILLIAETLGSWYVSNKLVITNGKIDDAFFVYQMAIITACAGIINTPYSGIFNAKEKFAFLATLDICNCIIRLLCVIALKYYEGNSLRAYTFIMCLTTLNSFIIYRWYSHKWWPEIIKGRFIRGWNNYKPLLSFGFWNLLTTSSIMARNTGSDLVINAFFGTAVNGVFAISKTISSQVLSFSSNFDAASGPQIIQSYNTHNFSRCYYLVNKMGRFSLLIFELALFPLWIELDFLLHIWLKEVPDGVLFLCKLNLLLVAVSLTCGGLTQLVNGSGKIKWFNIATSVCYLLCLPIGSMLFSLGYPAYSMIVLFIVADSCLRMIHLIMLRKILKFNSLKYIKEAYTKPFVIAMVMFGLIAAYSHLNVTDVYFRVLAILMCFVITFSLVILYGLTSGERNKMFAKLINIIKFK
jgi:O-antigen/teichoic acid export membrane protein